MAAGEVQGVQGTLVEHQGPGTIDVRGAREHNLADVSVSLPRQQLVVVTGPSGSGKSSLAFDTIFAEGQRRYVESLSAYARQFLGQMSKPDVDSIEGLSPAIAIDQKTSSSNPRSTVGTVTEIHDYLRLLWARVGVPHCPDDGSVLGASGPTATADRVAAWDEGTRILVLAPVVKARKGTHVDVLDQLAQDGFARARVDGEIVELSSVKELDKNLRHDIDVVVDRIIVRPDSRQRILDSLETALRAGDGQAAVETVTADLGRLVCSLRFGCPTCGKGYLEPEPRTFSFNSPFGACSTCDGIGTRFEGDIDLVVPDPSMSLSDGALAPWRGLHRSYQRAALEAVCAAGDIDMTVPFSSLPRRQRDALLYGTGRDLHRSWTGKDGTTKNWTFNYTGVMIWLSSFRSSAMSDRDREQAEAYMREVPCHECSGSRLAPYPRAVTVSDTGIDEVSAMTVTDALEWFNSLELDPRRATIAARILKEVGERLRFLDDVGLGYLTLDRAAKSLSGGESQRIRLASQVGSGLTGVLYVLDEPSIGLHPRDTQRLLTTLTKLRDLGNSVLVVEHDEDTMRAADWIVDVGPAAGEHGGRIVACGHVADIEAVDESVTGAYLSGRRAIPTPATRRPPQGTIDVIGASEHNLRTKKVSFPLGCLVSVTGVSGSGKSTLVSDILHPALAAALHGSRQHPGRHKRIDGLDQIDKCIAIDQSPIGRTPRSNPATYTGVFDKIRALFSQLPESRARGWKPGRFSFNVAGGRCETCTGEGTIKIEMHFLPDIWVPCESCSGRRYNQDTLTVKFKGQSIADVLESTVEEARTLFSAQPPIKRVLDTLCDVGLGYVRLGQPATQLSGGEAQRVKLASELCKRSTGQTLYLLDEPTTGLHFCDVERLVEVLHRLVDAGNTVVVIEHHLDVMRASDWIIDLGPEPGLAGGLVVAAGTPEHVATVDGSHTASHLAEALAAHPPVVPAIPLATD
jgi:excinuclease ABC subunit A